MKKLLLFIAAMSIVAPTARMFATPVEFIDTDAIAKLMKANDIDAIRKKFSEKVFSGFTDRQINFANSDLGNDYFMLALEHGTPEMVTLFLDNGFNMNILRSVIACETPLIVAAKAGNQPVVELLLNNGADTTLSNFNGKTAADVAKDSATRNLIVNYPKALGQRLSEVWAEDEQRKKELKATATTPEQEPIQSSRHPLNLIAEYAGAELPATAPAADVSSSAAAAPGTGAQTTEMEEEFYGVDMDTSE